MAKLLDANEQARYWEICDKYSDFKLRESKAAREKGLIAEANAALKDSEDALLMLQKVERGDVVMSDLVVMDTWEEFLIEVHS